MEPLERTTSIESDRSRRGSHTLSAASSPSFPDRKARHVGADTTAPCVDPASLIMPAPKIHPRRPSRIAEYSFTASGLRDQNSRMKEPQEQAVVVEETGRTTPTLEAMRRGNVSPTGSLPEPAFPSRRSEPDLDSNRLSFSSWYNIGSAIYDRARAMASTPSSVAESEADSTLHSPTHPRSTH